MGHIANLDDGTSMACGRYNKVFNKAGKYVSDKSLCEEIGSRLRFLETCVLEKNGDDVTCSYKLLPPFPPIIPLPKPGTKGVLPSLFSLKCGPELISRDVQGRAINHTSICTDTPTSRLFLRDCPTTEATCTQSTTGHMTCIEPLCHYEELPVQ